MDTCGKKKGEGGGGRKKEKREEKKKKQRSLNEGKYKLTFSTNIIVFSGIGAWSQEANYTNIAIGNVNSRPIMNPSTSASLPSVRPATLTAASASK